LITTRDFQWSGQGQHLVLGLDEAGDGALVLVLPALSSISTRGEMRPLMERLVSQFRVVTIDCGDRPFFAKIRSAIEMPGIGSLLYRLNVNSFVVGKMVARMSPLGREQDYEKNRHAIFKRQQ
jgi:hypothetical protein